MATTTEASRFTHLPDEAALAETVEIRQDTPGRIHIVLIRTVVGF